MTVIVTGATGFVGRALVLSLARGGVGGVATGRVAPAKVPAGWSAAARSSILGGLRRSPTAEAVIHLEVKQHVEKPSSADVKDFESVNVAGTCQWLDWASRNGITTFVLASSIKAVHADGDEVDEAAEPESLDPYGCSKARAEEAVRMWCDETSERRGVILRFAPIYGPGNEANLAAFARQVCEGKPCLIGQGQVRKSIVSRLNAVAAIEHVLGLPALGISIFNVADRIAPSLRELAEMIADATDSPRPRSIPVIAAWIAAKAGDLLNGCFTRDFPLTSRRFNTLTTDSIVSSAKLTATGFELPQTTAEGIAEMAVWIARSSRS